MAAEADPADAGIDADLDEDLRGKVRRGGRDALVAKVLRTGIGFGSTMVLARLVDPAEFGVLAMAGTVVAAAGLVTDLGLVDATVREPRLRPEEATARFWLSSAAGVAVGAAVYAAAPAVGRFYGAPRLASVLRALVPVLVFSAAGSQLGAVLRRGLRQRRLAAVDLAATTSGAAVAIALARGGHGVWALVAGQVTAAAVALAGAAAASPWRPGRPGRGTAARRALAFGSGVLGFRVLNYLSRTLDDIVVGRVFGAPALAAYSKAYALLTLPLRLVTEPVSAVAVPALSRLLARPGDFAAAYRDAALAMTFVTVPLAVWMGVYAELFVAVALGPRWAASAPLFRVMAAAAVTQPLSASAGWLWVATGRADGMFRYGLVATPLLCGAILAGATRGVYALAAAYTATSVALTAPSLWLAARDTPVRPARLLPALAGQLAAAGAAAGAATGLDPLAAAWPAPARLAFSGVAGAVVYLGILLPTAGFPGTLRGLATPGGAEAKGGAPAAGGDDPAAGEDGPMGAAS